MRFTIYRTTIRLEGEYFYYFGKHETTDPNDSYLGSGSVVKSLLKSNVRNDVSDFLIQKKTLCEVESESLMNELEELVINEARDKFGKYCVNIAEGGTGGDVYRHRSSFDNLETKKKMSKSRLGIKRTEETKQRIREALSKIDMSHSEEVKRVISERTKAGMERSGASDKIRNALFGKKRSKESIDKFSATFSKMQCYPWLNKRALSDDSQLMWSLSPLIYEVHLELPELKDSALKNECVKRGINIPSKCRLYSMLQWFKTNDPRLLPVPVI